mgnify:CR=1 FL=1
MADEIDALLERVTDADLRADLREQFVRLRRKRQFGLVFEEHLPERVALHRHPIRRGIKAVPLTDLDAEPSTVLAVGTDETKLLTAEEDAATVSVPTSDLVAIAEFGEPIYPGLKRVGSIDRGGNRPAQVVIKGENHHALEALAFTHAGKVDCIYIDPPYNSGARDWKYNNDYVDADDSYRHSKWLAFMKRRLALSRALLNPDSAMLIVTIDEKEFLRLGLLIEQEFPTCRVQMVSITISPRGTSRANEFSRVNEFAFFVFIGRAELQASTSQDSEEEVRWLYLRRTQTNLVRGSRPNQFYAVYVDDETRKIVKIGPPLALEDDISDIEVVAGATPVFPINPDGLALTWGLTGPSLQRVLDGGYVRVTPGNEYQPYVISYLSTTNIKRVESGEFRIAGLRPDGSKIVVTPGGKPHRPTTVWRDSRHDAGAYGTSLVRSLIPDRNFPFPKSLYAVEDCLRLAVAESPNATILDFFAGSGTTAHAVSRLNHQDGGSRQSISVTNNEVSDVESSRLAREGFRPGDAEWESQGIFEHVTRPRIEAAISGKTRGGDDLQGEYKFVDEFPMAEGFEENVEFLELVYLDADDVELDLAFERIAPLLWMRAGSHGHVVEQRKDDGGVPLPFACTDVYAVLFQPDHWRGMVADLGVDVTTVFVVTDSASTFSGVAAELPDHIEVVRLYENYLSTFAINQRHGPSGRGLQP